MAIIALIPAYNPDELLISLLCQLSSQKQFDQIVVVNDGSCCPESQAVFADICHLKRVTLLQHSINLGKGAALKTGLDYINYHFINNLVGVVTLDADGQHDIQDVIAIANQLYQYPHRLIVGVRRFNKHMPWRSRLGNVITKYFFR